MLLKLLERLDSRLSPCVVSLTTVGEIGLRIKKIGINVEALNMQPKLPNPKTHFRLVRKLQSLRPDIVQTWMYHADLVGGVAARLAGAPNIVWGIRNSDLSPDRTKRSTRWTAMICANLSRLVPDRILFCSHQAQVVHTALGYDASRSSVISNGFDIENFKPNAIVRESVRRELGIPINSPLIGRIARFDPQKYIEGFLDAASILHQSMPYVHFLLAGKGLDCGNLELMSEIEARKLKIVVHPLGLRTDIPRLTAALDIASSTSWGEAFPNVIGEAMACCVPCVVTDVGDSAYIVGETGRVVAPGDMAGFARACEELLRLPFSERAALGKSARARVAEHFEIGKVVRRYEAFYDELATIDRS